MGCFSQIAARDVNYPTCPEVGRGAPHDRSPHSPCPFEALSRFLTYPLIGRAADQTASTGNLGSSLGNASLGSAIWAADQRLSVQHENCRDLESEARRPCPQKSCLPRFSGGHEKHWRLFSGRPFQREIIQERDNRKQPASLLGFRIWESPPRKVVDLAKEKF